MISSALVFIVLDTNIIQADRFVRKVGFEILRDYATRTQSTVVLPRLVVQELEWNYRRLLTEKLQAVKSAVTQFHRFSLNEISVSDFDIEKEVGAYLQHLKDYLPASLESVLEPTMEDYSDAIHRSVSRRRPCSQSGEEIRDAIIWDCILGLVRTGKNVVFISANTAEFGTDNTLYPELAAEVEGLPGTLGYLNSLDEFAREHASRIQYITSDWIGEQIHGDKVLEAVREFIEDQAMRVALRRSDIEPDALEDFNIIGGELKPDDNFVYEMQTGDIKLEAQWYGEIEIEYSARYRDRSLAGDPWLEAYAQRMGDIDSNITFYPDPTERNWVPQTVLVEVYVWTSADVKDKHVGEWSVKSVEVV
jgi:hypothetical protein